MVFFITTVETLYTNFQCIHVVLKGSTWWYEKKRWQVGKTGLSGDNAWSNGANQADVYMLLQSYKLLYGLYFLLFCLTSTVTMDL